MCFSCRPGRSRSRQRCCMWRAWRWALLATCGRPILSDPALSYAWWLRTCCASPASISASPRDARADDRHDLRPDARHDDAHRARPHCTAAQGRTRGSPTCCAPCRRSEGVSAFPVPSGIRSADRALGRVMERGVAGFTLAYIPILTRPRLDCQLAVTVTSRGASRDPPEAFLAGCRSSTALRPPTSSASQPRTRRELQVGSCCSAKAISRPVCT